MTNEPELLRRRDVLRLGISEELLKAVVRVVGDARELAKLPPRTIAAIRPTRSDGKRARLLYFASTLRVFVPEGKF
jgi:hypothetical protein